MKNTCVNELLAEMRQYLDDRNEADRIRIAEDCDAFEALADAACEWEGR